MHRSDPCGSFLSEPGKAVDWPLAQALAVVLRALSVAGGSGVAQDHAQEDCIKRGDGWELLASMWQP